MLRKGCELIDTLQEVEKKSVNLKVPYNMSRKGVLIYRYPARCREKGCKSIGTLQDVEKRGVNLWVPGLARCREKGVNIYGYLARCREKGCKFGKIYLPKGVFFSKIYRYLLFANDRFYLV